MLILINGVLYDSMKTPVLLIFDTEKEKEIFGMNRFVSAPEESTVEDRQALIDTRLEDMIIDKLNINKVVYYRFDGTVLFEEPMIFSRLWLVGQDMIHDYKTYIVKHVDVIGDVQYVHLQGGEQ